MCATPGYTRMQNPYLAMKLKQTGAQFIVQSINSGTNQKERPFHKSSAELWEFLTKISIIVVNAAKQTGIINAQSGLIGERSIRISDSGIHFFTVRINTTDRAATVNQNEKEVFNLTALTEQKIEYDKKYNGAETTAS